MLVGIVSDIHCNAPGLRAGLAQMGNVDEIFCAGDAVLESRWSNEVVGLLRDVDAKTVLGNHEEVLLGPLGTRALEADDVDQELVAWLRAQPEQLVLERDGKRVLMTHGSPWAPLNDYLYPHDSKWARARSLDCDTLIVGHTHFKMAERFGDVLVINPGSAGDPRDHRNGRRLSCATWDTVADEVVFYDYANPGR